MEVNYFLEAKQTILGDHSRAGANPSKWATETALVITVGHCNGVVRAFTLEQMHRGKGLRAGGVHLIL